MTDEQGLDRLQVTVSEAAIGMIGRGPQRSDSVFTYASDAYEKQSVSLTMPARLESYRWEPAI
jgi:serine/threonine-protein kinase HipA